MKHLDITVDIETLASSPNAAILQIAAVAWDRDNTDSPFIDTFTPFVGNVDIRSCVKDNFDFNPDTIKWWSEQKKEVQDVVLSPEAHPLKDVLESFVQWIRDVYSQSLVESVCLWAQGSDFDIAILRNAFSRYGMEFPVSYTSFRDARTFIIEVGAYLMMQGNPIAGVADPSQVYSLLPKNMSDSLDAHIAVNDACRTTCDVWYLLRQLKSVCGKGILLVDPGVCRSAVPKGVYQAEN